MTLALVTNNTTATMSTVDLFELVNTERGNYGQPHVRLNDFINRCKDELDGEHYEIFVVKNSNNTSSEHLMLTKDQCMYVAMRESKGVRRAVVAKINEFEQPKFSIPQTYSEALRLCADQHEAIEIQRNQLEQQKPAVEFLDRFVEAKSNKNFREVAKILGVQERAFIKSLEDDKIVFRQSGNLLPFAHYQHAGWFTVKTGEANGRAIVQTRFTPSGIAWIAKRYANE